MPQAKKLYNALWPVDLQDWEIELACFRDGRSKERGGLGRLGHLKKVARAYFPTIEWNPWLEDQLESLCNDSYAHRHGNSTVRCINWTGCGAAGKTHSAGFFAVLWWLASPQNSSVTLTSTSKTAIGQRVWPVVQKLVAEAVDPATDGPFSIGHLVDSMKVLQAKKGDAKHAIHALAVEKGELQKAVNSIKGRHTERMMLVIDEANTTPPAVFEAIPNMLKGCREFVLLVIGNAVSRYDNHGRCCEPAAGWENVDVNTGRWPTVGVREWGVEPGICCHYDGEKSPNVVAQKTLYPYIYTWENYKRRKADNSSIQYWSQDKGFWPPEGTLSTVLSEVMVEKYDGKGKFTFLTRRTPLAFLDTAFGGDACVAVFGTMGDVEGGKLGIQIDDKLEITPTVESPDEIDYQVARRFIDECKRRGVEPRHAGMDATGTGRGAYAIAATEWGSDLQRVEFGGAPSDLPASAEDPRPSKEVYDRKVTELWYSVREFLLARQLKGLYKDAIIQFCTRQFTLWAKKIKLDTKEDCKEKLGRSPDDADAIAGLVEVARRNGARPQSGIGKRRDDSWKALQSSLTKLHDGGYVEEAVVQQHADDGEPMPAFSYGLDDLNI